MQGSGTSASPWLVTDYDDLKKVGRGYDAETDNIYDLGDHYLVTDNIDMSPSEQENEGAGWLPIGAPSSNFTGVFDGDGYSLSGMYIDRETDNNGLFRRANTANCRIKNFGISANVNCSGSSRENGIIGGEFSQGVEVHNVRTSGVIVSESFNTGGMVGALSSSSRLYNCYTDVDVTGNNRTGGLVGGQYGGAIENCYVSGAVTAGGGSGAITGFYDPDASGTETTSCYWLEGVFSSSPNGTMLDDSEMKDIVSFVDWDIEYKNLFDPTTPTTWWIDDGVDFPRLFFEFEDEPDSISGTATGKAIASGALSGVGALSGAITGTAIVTGQFESVGALSGAITGSATLTATIDGIGNISGISSGQVTAFAVIMGTGELSGQIIGRAVLSGEIENAADPANLSGQATGRAVLGGQILATGGLKGSAVASSVAAGSLEGLADISGAATGRAIVSGELRDGAQVISGLIKIEFSGDSPAIDFAASAPQIIMEAI